MFGEIGKNGGEERSVIIRKEGKEWKERKRKRYPDDIINMSLIRYKVVEPYIYTYISISISILYFNMKASKKIYKKV